MSTSKKLQIKAEKAMTNGSFLKAIELLDDLLEVHPGEKNYLLMRGEAHLRLENYEAGLVDFAKVVEVDNKNIAALVNFAAALIRCNKHSDAKDILEYVLELEPDSFDAHINLCNIYQTLGKSEESLKLSIRAIQIRPGSVVAYNNLGTAFGDLNMVSESRDAYMEDTLFDQLRVTPFYRAVAKVNPPLDARIHGLISEITTIKMTLVHGDFSPKNIMISGSDKPIVLDFEVMHTGNPVFDLGFVSAHLLCKYLRTEDTKQRALLRETAISFINSYSQTCNTEVAKSFPHHVAVIALARVEGVSPVNYLEKAGKARVQSVTKTALANPEITFEGLFA
jgi:tetratricopeptide (TPR) repeat protein